MAIKWGSTYVTVVKWGNTVCTQVKWGNTVVFPVGGYDGSTFSPPLTGGIRYYYGNGGMGIWTNVTSGAISFTWYHYHTSSTSLSIGDVGSINDAIDFSQYTKIKISGSTSTTASGIRIANYAQIWEWKTTSGEYYDKSSKQMLAGGFAFDTEYSFTSTRTGVLGLHFEFSNSSGVFSANHTVTVTKIELYN